MFAHAASLLICDSVTICVVVSSRDWSRIDSLRMLSSNILDMFTSSSCLSLLVPVLVPDAFALYSALLLLPDFAFAESLDKMLLMLLVTALTYGLLEPLPMPLPLPILMLL